MTEKFPPHIPDSWFQAQMVEALINEGVDPLEAIPMAEHLLAMAKEMGEAIKERRLALDSD